MSGYNTECWPERLEIEGEPDEQRPTNLHHKLTVVFACGRRVPYSYSHRYQPAENRRMCRHCKRAREKPRLTWDEVHDHYRAEYRHVLDRQDRDHAGQTLEPST